MPSVRGAMTGLWEGIADLPLPVRFAVAGGAVLGIPGGVAGLIVGLIAYPPTAWFAIVELGAPVSLVGVVLGLLAGSVACGVRRLRARSATR